MEGVITNVRLTGQEPEVKVEATPVVTEPAQTAEPAATSADPVLDEKPEVKVAEPAATQPVISEPEVKVQPATEKKDEPYDWYKENGFDDTHKEFLDKFHAAVKANKAQEFLEIATKDYDKVNDIDMLRMDIRERHPKATVKQLEILERTELKNRGIDLDDLEGEQTMEGLEILALDMDKTREGYKTKQKEYTIPAYDASIKQQEEAAKVREEYLTYINNNEQLRAFERDKIVKFGEDKVDLPEGLNPRSFLENPNNFWALFDDGKNGIDMDKLMKTLVFVVGGPDNFHSNSVKMGKSSAEKAHFDEVRNPKVGSAATAVVSPDDGTPKITNIRHTGQI